MSKVFVLNGQDREIEQEGELTLTQLIVQLGFQADRVAIELNRTIVPRAQWPQTRVLPGDRVEVVHFVGGGAPVSANRSCSHRSP